MQKEKNRRRRKEKNEERKRINFYQCDISDNCFFVRQTRVCIVTIHARTAEHQYVYCTFFSCV
jgi:hypothetical protein